MVPSQSLMPNWIKNNNDHKFGKPTDPNFTNLNKSDRITEIVTNDFNRMFLTQLIKKNAQE